MQNELEVKLGDRVRVVQINKLDNGLVKKDEIKRGIAIEIFKDFVRVCDLESKEELSNLKFCELFPISSPAGLGVEVFEKMGNKERKAVEEILKWL